MASEAPVEDIFAGMKKKKKSSKKVDFGSLDLDSPATVTEPTAAPADEASTPAESAEITQTEAQSAAVTQDSGELDFSDLKKKKKKKTVRIAEDDDEESQVAQPKKKTTDALGNEIVETEDGPVDTSAAPNSVATDDFDDFADLKKKKKKGTKKNVFDLEAFEKELAQTESEISSTATSAAPGKPLKSALVSKTSTPGESDGEDAAGDDMDEDIVPTGEDPFAANQTEEQTLSKAEQAATAKVWLKEGSRDYHYDELLGRFYQMLFQSHPSLSGGAGKKKYTIPPPQLGREGSKRSVFANVGEICKRMHRQPEHVIQFVFAELGTTGSVDGSGRLIIKGRFQQKQMENVLRRYIVEYVTCRTCKSPDTLLTKDNRLFFMTCESCGSTRSVSAIKTGFQAQTGKRKAMKAAGQ